MRQPGVRDYGALAAITSTSGMNLLLALYLAHAGHSVGLIGLLSSLGAVAALLSRIPVPRLYRPERSGQLLIGTAALGTVTGVVLPFLPDLVAFTPVFLVNRVMGGIATAVYLARFLDLIEGGDRRRLMGYYGGTQAAGHAAAGLFTGLIADFVSFTAAFFFNAGVFALTALLLLGVANPTGHVAQQRMARSTATTADQAGQPRSRLRRWLAGVDDPGLWRVLNVNTWNQFFQSINSTFFPVLATAIGLPPAQVGVIRAVFAGTNAVSRPVAGLVMGRIPLRQIAYLGLGLQAVLVLVMPWVREVVVFVVVMVVYGLGRAVVVVAASAGLAEEVDPNRVSRGTATATFSTSSDLANVGAPLLGGAVASAVSVMALFPLTAVGFFGCFLAGDLLVERWRARHVSPTPQPAAST
jgi:MFS family permease